VKSFLKAVTLSLGLVVASASNATVIDFTTMADGNVTTIGDTTWSLAGSGEAGSPYVDSRGNDGIWNSTDGVSYPTNTILRVDFDSVVSGVNFTYNPYGLHGTGQGWYAYDSSASLIASGSFLSGYNIYDLSSYSGITRIDWNNGGNDWLSSVSRLEYTATSVPEPSAIALMGLGLFGFAATRRKLAK